MKIIICNENNLSQTIIKERSFIFLAFTVTQFYGPKAMKTYELYKINKNVNIC